MLLGWRFHCFAPNWDLLLCTCIDITLATPPNCREAQCIPHRKVFAHSCDVLATNTIMFLQDRKRYNHHLFLKLSHATGETVIILITTITKITITSQSSPQSPSHHNHHHNHHHITIITILPLRTATSCWTSARSWCRPWWRGSAALTPTSG